MLAGETMYNPSQAVGLPARCHAVHRMKRALDASPLTISALPASPKHRAPSALPILAKRPSPSSLSGADGPQARRQRHIEEPLTPPPAPPNTPPSLDEAKNKRALPIDDVGPVEAQKRHRDEEPLVEQSSFNAWNYWRLPLPPLEEEMSGVDHAAARPTHNEAHLTML